MVMVAAGMVALLTFAAFAVDVGYMYLNRAQLEAMSMAAARAGYESLRNVNFQYAANQAYVDDTIRRYLEENGATAAEAAAASIQVERRGTIRVTATRDAPTFFWRVQGNTVVGVAGLGEIVANNLAPFAIPTTYQDQNQDGYSNWELVDESISTTPTPWEYEQDKPYIVKFGKESGQPGTDNDWVFIPMDDDAHTIYVGSGPSAYTLPAQTYGNTGSSLLHTDRSLTTSKASRASQTRTNIGLLRAYGIMYDCAGVVGGDQKGTYWVLGYDGGGFLVAKDTLAVAGYSVGPETANANASYRANILKGAVDTNVRCIPLNSKLLNPNFRPLDVDFLKKLDVLALNDKIRLLKIPKQPQIATFTENNDPVTCTMMNAGIPFTAFFLQGSTSTFHTFSIDPLGGESKVDIKAKLDAPANGGPFEWLHLHHEDFSQSGASDGSNPYAMETFVDFISDWVRVEQKFIFAACWATDTLEIALAKLSSPNWTVAGGVPTAHMDDYGLSLAEKAVREIRYDKTFAFNDFFITKNYANANANDEWRQGNVIPGSIHEGCGASCAIDSEINTEYAEVKGMYLDYLNPLTQNHVGFGGIELLEETDLVGTYVATDDINERGGATDSFRHRGARELHCDQSAKPDPFPDIAQPTNTTSLSTANENQNYRDHDDRDRMWVREFHTSTPCDYNGDGDTNDYIRLKDLINFRLPCGPLETGNPHARWSTNPTGDVMNSASQDGYSIQLRHLNNDGDSSDSRSSTLLRENDDTQDWPNCDPDHDHEVLRPHVGAIGGATLASEIDPTKEILILAQGPGNPPNAEDTGRTLKYISGIGDDDGDINTGFGRWSYLGGHSPGHSDERGKYDAPNLHSSSSHEEIGIEGMRIYLNNILFGSTQGIQPGGAFTPSTGAVNPGALGLGSGAGDFGDTGSSTANGFQTIFMVGSNGIGLPMGAQFKTAPGNFSAQTQEASDFLFTDGTGPSSQTWTEFQALPASQKATHPQVVSIAIVERIPLGTAITPTPEANLSDYMPPSANAARDKSIYGGAIALPEDDPGQARDVHVVGFSEYFLIDPANQNPQTTDSSVPAHFVTTIWKPGEVRGYFLRYIIPPHVDVVYPASPAADPR